MQILWPAQVPFAAGNQVLASGFFACHIAIPYGRIALQFPLMFVQSQSYLDDVDQFIGQKGATDYLGASCRTGDYDVGGTLERHFPFCFCFCSMH